MASAQEEYADWGRKNAPLLLSLGLTPQPPRRFYDRSKDVYYYSLGHMFILNRSIFPDTISLSFFENENKMDKRQLQRYLDRYVLFRDYKKENWSQTPWERKTVKPATKQATVSVTTVTGNQPGQSQSLQA